MRYAGTMAAMMVLGAAVPALGELVSIPPIRDNTLFQDAAGSVSNGAGSGFFAGSNSQLMVRRGLIAFDIAANIPAGATITGATLTLHMSSAQSATVGVALHRALADWGEGTSNAGPSGGSGAPATPNDATWLHTFYPGMFWSAPGGDFVSAASAAQTVAGVGFYSWSSAALAADVQGWLDAPAANFGWMLIGAEGIASSAKRFDSREIQDPALRPVLQVSYIPAPGVLGALALFGAVAAARRRR